jgi:hypothetical protein
MNSNIIFEDIKIEGVDRLTARIGDKVYVYPQPYNPWVHVTLLTAITYKINYSKLVIITNVNEEMVFYEMTAKL